MVVRFWKTPGVACRFFPPNQPQFEIMIQWGLVQAIDALVVVVVGVCVCVRVCVCVCVCENNSLEH